MPWKNEAKIKGKVKATFASTIYRTVLCYFIHSNGYSNIDFKVSCIYTIIHYMQGCAKKIKKQNVYKVIDYKHALFYLIDRDRYDIQVI